MTQLPTDRTDQNTIAEHVSDHNTLCGQHNELDGHAAATTTVHGIASAAALVLTGDARLSDARVPTAGSVVDASVSDSAAIAESKLSLASDASAGTASRRSLGTSSTQAAAGDHGHSGSLVLAVAGKTAAYNAVAGDVILADATSGALTVTLPVPALNALVTVKKIDASTNNVVVARHAAETIDGGASAALAVRYASVDVISNGTDWFVI